ncbi:adhesion G protein-coupled receptor E3-like isoform X2 [Pristis pectinata]|uniref:adhesion G protein-coupled receptor E3-like isoform X2 n=1 Tax=Pristis pectinata TaxID=685728 RepID=UPI00223E371C|nr:adhesion G protein-coupled receptor E3-like isoform X2 [Pristis pectinata]
MDWGWCSLVRELYLGCILLLPVVTSQPCRSGFKLMTNQDCIDIDECEDRQLCGANTMCQNTVGSYYCSSMHGFQSYLNASHRAGYQEVASGGHTRLRERAALDRQDSTEADHGNTTAPDHGSMNMPDNRSTPEPGSGSSPELASENTFNLITESTPKPYNGNTPEPGNRSSPDPDNRSTPEPDAGTRSAPKPGTKITPKPGTKITPEPETRNTPEPDADNGSTLEPGTRSTLEPDADNGSTPEPPPEPESSSSSTPPTDVRSHSDPAGQGDLGLTSTLEQPASPGGQFCSMATNESRIFDKLCHNADNGLQLEDVILYTTELLMEDVPLVGMRQDERINSASSLLTAVERAAITLGLSSAKDKVKNITHQEIDLQVIRVDSKPTANSVRLQAKENALDVSWRTDTNTSGKGFAVFAFIVYNNLDPILQGARHKDQESGDLYEDIQLYSKVVSAALELSPKTSFSVAVNFVLKHKEVAAAGGRLSCVYWSHTPTGSYWSTSGCRLVHSNSSHTRCQCHHLSSFAILMAFNKKLQGYSQDALSTITFIGIPISLLCLLVALSTFTFCSQARNSVSATHTQLCLSLFLAELLFLVGINRTENRAMCGIVAGCLHYLFLVAFTWMSLESTQLYLMVRNLRKMRVPNSSQLGKLIYPLGYGSPALIVAISAVINPNGYGSERNCWLQVENGFVWSFLGPVYLIILANTFLFTTTLYTLNEELSNRDMKVSKIKDTRMLIFKAISQVFILGCTWILGLFHFQEETVVMAYLFTIVNSFQGTFIFIILCILNPKIRDEYQKWIFSICKTRRILFDSESTKMPLSVTSEIV